MARIRRRRMFWTDPQATDLEAIEIYAGLAADYADNAAFLAAIEADQVTPHAEVTPGVGEYYLANLSEDTYHLAIAGRDDDGNHSDVAQHPAWIAVPLDVSPPDAPVAGGLE